MASWHTSRSWKINIYDFFCSDDFYVTDYDQFYEEQIISQGIEEVLEQKEKYQKGYTLVHITYTFNNSKMWNTKAQLI